MQIDLSNKVAIITGAAGRGLGRADALMLGHAGCKVALVDVEDLAETLDILKTSGVTGRGYKCDISNATQTRQTVENILSDLGAVHILVNNASILTTVGMFGEIPIEKWDRDVQVNLIGSANITRAVWPYLMKQSWGRVIFMSSVAGTRGGLGQTSYAATKAGVVGLAKSLALEGARASVTVNAIAPGIIETRAVDFIRPDMRERMKKAIPLRRFGKPEEIAGLITYLCSDYGAYLTGQVYEVDGGTGLFVF